VTSTSIANGEPNPHAINQLVIDGLIQETRELLDRVLDLESERDVYRFWFQQTLTALHLAVDRGKRRAEEVDRLEGQLRTLRAIVVAECYDDAAAILTGYDHRNQSGEVTIQ
jgi:hypothetical protein